MSSGSVEEVKSKLDIVQVVGDYLQLKKAGVSFRAPCPFHHEKTPSFYVHPERQIWHCFGCGEGGDMFEFVMRMEGLEFYDALRHLAKKAGVTLKHIDDPAHDEKQRLFDINRMAARYFHEVLLRASVAESARAYVKKRELADATLEDFLIGFAPESWDMTSSFLKKKGYRDLDIFNAGITAKSDRGSGYYDRFRGRLMFPIRDLVGNIIGFTGRVLPGAPKKGDREEAKYVNTPQTMLYNKGHVLFCLDRAKRPIKNQGFAVVVEGNMDAIASHQAGIKNVVASSGTAFTAEQLQLLRRLTERLYLSFDADAAGENAARRSIEAATQAGFLVRIITIPEDAGKDPDDCIRKDPKLWQAAIDNAVPYMDWYIDLTKKRLDFKNPEAKRQAAKELSLEVAKIEDAVERTHWVGRLADLFATQQSLLAEQIEKLRPKPNTTPNTSTRPQQGLGSAGNSIKQSPALSTVDHTPTKRHASISSHILAIICTWPEMFETAAANLPDEVIEVDSLDLYKAVSLFYTDERTVGLSQPNFAVYCGQKGDRDTAQKIAVLALLAEKEFGDLDVVGKKAALLRLIDEAKKLHKARRQRELVTAMADAERHKDSAMIDKIQQEIDLINR